MINLLSQKTALVYEWQNKDFETLETATHLVADSPYAVIARGRSFMCETQNGQIQSISPNRAAEIVSQIIQENNWETLSFSELSTTLKEALTLPQQDFTNIERLTGCETPTCDILLSMIEGGLLDEHLLEANAPLKVRERTFEYA